MKIDSNENSSTPRSLSDFYLDQDSPVTIRGRTYVQADLPSGARVRGVSRMQPTHINALTLWFDRPPTEADITALHLRLTKASGAQP